jgi:hypothetical protein
MRSKDQTNDYKRILPLCKKVDFDSNGLYSRSEGFNTQGNLLPENLFLKPAHRFVEPVAGSMEIYGVIWEQAPFGNFGNIGNLFPRFR